MPERETELMRIDRAGKKCGALTVLEKADVYRKHDTRWLCRCDCGNIVRVRGSYLRNGHTKTCGHCVTYIDKGDYIKCIVKSGKAFVFDRRDLNIVSKYTWSVSQEGYVISGTGKECIKLHRLLLGNPINSVVDHINGHPWDCRRCNLRFASQQQNTQNSVMPKSNTTGYKGVCFDKRRKKYIASIHPNGRTKFLGYYNSPYEAALAYDRAAIYYYGEFARPNFRKEENNEQVLEVQNS